MNNDSIIEENYNNWIQSPFDKTTIQDVINLKKNNAVVYI